MICIRIYIYSLIYINEHLAVPHSKCLETLNADSIILRKCCLLHLPKISKPSEIERTKMEAEIVVSSSHAINESP